jgi:hypothetical protein
MRKTLRVGALCALTFTMLMACLPSSRTDAEAATPVLAVACHDAAPVLRARTPRPVRKRMRVNRRLRPLAHPRTTMLAVCTRVMSHPLIRRAPAAVHPAPRRVSAQRVRREVRTPVTQMSVRQILGRALCVTGEPQRWLNALCWMANRESADNPHAVAWEQDGGQYAEGLLQLLPTTFQAHELPGYSNIWNPLDNAIAAIRYISTRYGNPGQIPGVCTADYAGY